MRGERKEKGEEKKEGLNAPSTVTCITTLGIFRRSTTKAATRVSRTRQLSFTRWYVYHTR